MAYQSNLYVPPKFSLKGSPRGLLGSLNTSSQTTTPIGYTTAPSSNKVNAAYGGTQKVPINNQINSNPTGYKIPSSSGVPAGGLTNNDHTDITGLLEKIIPQIVKSRATQNNNQTSGTTDTNQNNTTQNQTDQNTQNNTQDNPTPTSTPPNINDYGLWGQLTGQARDVAQGIQPAVEKTAQQISDLEQNLAKETQNVGSIGGDSSLASGRGALYQQTAAAKESALQGQLLNQIAGAQAAAGIYSGAAGQIPEALRYGPGGIGTAGSIQGRLAMSQALPQQKAALTNVSGLKNSINTLFQSSGINPSQFTDINAITQFLYGKVADPRYQSLSNSVSQYVQTIAPILGMDVNTIAANIKGNGGNVIDTLNNLYSQAQYRVAVNEAMVNGTQLPTPPTSQFSSGGGSSNDPLGIR